MLKEVNRVFPHIAHRAVQSTPGARVISVHTIYADEGGLADTWMDFSNEFVEVRFHGEYARLLRQQAARSSQNVSNENRPQSEGPR